jgi:hypothetical protein
MSLRHWRAPLLDFVGDIDEEDAKSDFNDMEYESCWG